MTGPSFDVSALFDIVVESITLTNSEAQEGKADFACIEAVAVAEY